MPGRTERESGLSPLITSGSRLEGATGRPPGRSFQDDEIGRSAEPDVKGTRLAVFVKVDLVHAGDAEFRAHRWKRKSGPIELGFKGGGFSLEEQG